MGILRRLANRFDPETRDVSSRDPYLAEMLGGRDTASGQMITPERATGIPAVHACVQLIAETAASLPLAPFRRSEDEGREVDRLHPLYRVLHERANSVQTALEFREQFVASCLLTGNGYALKEIDGRGAVVALTPMHPDHVRPVKLVNGRVRYEVTPERGGTERYVQEEVLHLRYRSRDGFTGLSPITIARETIGVALAQQQHEGALYRNGVRPSGALKHPGTLGMEAASTLRESFQDAFSGPSNAGKVLVLEEGMDFSPLSMSQRDAEFVESRKLTLEDIARIFRVPPPAIGILDRATYSNVTEQSRALVMYTLRPWLVRIEQAMNGSLLTTEGHRSHFIEHNAEGLLRGNQKERFEAYRIGREWGWMSTNEIRRVENMGAIGSEGDTYRQPMNTEPLGVGAGG
ncbi:MAG: phage portal protein [Leptospirillia bacterium]